MGGSGALSLGKDLISSVLRCAAAIFRLYMMSCAQSTPSGRIQNLKVQRRDLTSLWCITVSRTGANKRGEAGDNPCTCGSICCNNTACLVRRRVRIYSVEHDKKHVQIFGFIIFRQKCEGEIIVLAYDPYRPVASVKLTTSNVAQAGPMVLSVRASLGREEQEMHVATHAYIHIS